MGLVLVAILAGLVGALPTAADTLPPSLRAVQRLCPNAASHTLRALANSEPVGMRRAFGDIGARPPAGHLPHAVIAELHGVAVSYDPAGIRLQRLSRTETLYLIPAYESSASFSPACRRAITHLPSVAFRRALFSGSESLRLERKPIQPAECAVAVVDVGAADQTAAPTPPMTRAKGLGCQAYPARYPSVLNDVNGRLLQIAPLRITEVTLSFSHRSPVLLHPTVPRILVSRRSTRAHDAAANRSARSVDDLHVLRQPPRSGTGPARSLAISISARPRDGATADSARTAGTRAWLTDRRVYSI